MQKWTTASDFNHYVTLSRHTFKKRGSDRFELSSIVLCIGNYHYIRDVVQVQKEKAPPLKPTDCHISVKLSSSTFKSELDDFEAKSCGGPFFDKNGITVPYSAFLTLLSDDLELKDFFQELHARYGEGEASAEFENDRLNSLVNFITPKNREPPILSPPQKKKRESQQFAGKANSFVDADEERIINEEFDADLEFGATSEKEKVDSNTDENKTDESGGNASDDDDDDGGEIIRRTSRKRLTRRLDFGEDSDVDEGNESEAEDPEESLNFEPLAATQASSIRKRGRGGRGRK